ncbi:MAG: efflux RND transporter permease subunit, partial [Parvibaculaceae bacterium]|nr:efflux RND transporter permease subunit [Parvibaculaceae bacterium]
MTDHQSQRSGLIGWFVSNHVAANLLMAFFLIAGLLALLGMRSETFPEIDIKRVTVSVVYPGATPYEVEDGITRRVEEAIRSVNGVDRVTSTAVEGAGTVIAKLDDFADDDEVLNDIKDAVDRISDFPPTEAEEPSVTKTTVNSGVLTLVVYGDASERAIRENAERIQEELLLLPGISIVNLRGVRTYEISIEVSEGILRQYGLTLSEIARTIRNTSLDLPAGSIKTASGEILLRTSAKSYTGREFGDIVIRSQVNGGLLRLRDIATIKDGFEDQDLISLFEGKPAAFINVNRTGDQDSLEIEAAIKGMIADLSLPKGLDLAIWGNETDILRDRISLLVRNGILGFALVFFALVMFLDLKLAFWTSMGIPISFMGGLLIASYFGVTINMVSLFALIVVLGIVVDDAIVAGENIFTEQEAGLKGAGAALAGVRGIAAPVAVGVFTTMAAFAPLLFVTGVLGQIMSAVPIIVISVLLVSLFEAFFILPAHLSSDTRWSRGALKRVQGNISDALKTFTQTKLHRWVQKAIRLKYLTLAIGLAGLILMVGILQGAFVRFVFFPDTEAESLTAELTMPEGTPVETTLAVTRRLLAAAEKLNAEIAEGAAPGMPDVFQRTSAVIGQGASSRGPGGTGAQGATSAHLAQIRIELTGSDDRNFSSGELEAAWRQAIGPLPGIESLTIESSLFSGDPDIEVRMSHLDDERLLEATEALKSALTQVTGAVEIEDSFDLGKRQLEFTLTPAGHAAGMTTNDLASQVREAFYGNEVQRVQRGREELKVMVRYPETERRSLNDLFDMRIRLADGSEAPLLAMASISESRGFSTITRVDSRRIATVTAEVDGALATPLEVNAMIWADIMPKLLDDIPGLIASQEGQSREQADDIASLSQNLLIAIFIIYVVLAAQLKSYIQPLIILMAVPFGFFGAILGHLVMGYDLTFISV